MGRFKVTKGQRKPDRPALTESAHDTRGMSSEQWNAAVQLQCAVRDGIDRPVSMLGTFEGLVEYFKAYGVDKKLGKYLRERFDRLKEEIESARAEADRIARASAK